MDDKTRERCEMLSTLGLIFNGREFALGDLNVHWTEITCDTDNEFQLKLDSISSEIERRANSVKP